MKLLLLLPLLAFGLAAQTVNPACPAATGATPHCVVLSWLPPASGPAPTAYNVYSGGTTKGQCATVTAAGCTKIGTVPASALTFTQNSTTSSAFTEGTAFFYVVTSANGTAESLPSTEVSATIPFLLPLSPVTPAAVAH